VTVESLLRELETARSQASSLNQLGAATQAIMGKAKLAGLLVQKTEQKVEVSNSFENAESTEELADMMLEDLARFQEVTEDDKAALVSLMRPRPPEHSVHGALHRTGAWTVQESLEIASR
jgi:hypothetical protein